jgi:hypothetical protein
MGNDCVAEEQEKEHQDHLLKADKLKRSTTKATEEEKQNDSHNCGSLAGTPNSFAVCWSCFLQA